MTMDTLNLVQLTCGKCGVPKQPADFYWKNGRPQTAWCRECYRSWYHARNGGLVDRACDHCGLVMKVTGRRAAEPRVFCSRKCKGEHREAQRKAECLASKTPRPCIRCGATIGPKMRSDAVFCSERCCQAAHSPTKRLDRAAIAERDGYLCGICGGAVDMTLAATHPQGPTIDHKTPLAALGGHDEDNLQLAHLSCNTSKRSKN